MTLADISIRRPVFATVLSLLLIVVGVMCLRSLPLRELPDVDPPVVSVSASYRGASAAVVESRVTQVIENAISGVEGLSTISSSSANGRSNVTLEFDLDRDIEAAANDVRAAVSRVSDDLPQEITPPEVRKQDADADPILWLNLNADNLDALALTDFAERQIVDRLSALPGVANVNIGGEQRYAMRIEIDRQQLAARSLTVADVEAALRRENLELPAGRLESAEREFVLRVERSYRDSRDFEQLPLVQQDDGHIVRLGEVARVVLAAEDRRALFRGNGQSQIGLGIVRQSKANTLEVVDGIKSEVARISQTLPPGMTLVVAFDTSLYIAEAIHEVIVTLLIAIALVLAVIAVFLGSWRAALVPAVTVPICTLGAFIGLAMFGFSINLITLLALVLAIGLVVDDAIVVLENCQRRVDLGEPLLLAAARGTRQVTFAVIATTAVLVAVFLPIAFLGGNIGRLFRELALAISAAVVLSSVVALSLSPMMCSKLLRPGMAGEDSALGRGLAAMGRGYRRSLTLVLHRPLAMLLLFLGLGYAAWHILERLPTELTPVEDQGAFFIRFTGPEGAGFDYTSARALEVEQALLPMVADDGVANRILIRVPGFGGGESINSGIALMFLKPWGERPDAEQIQADLQARLDALPGLQSFVGLRQSLNRSRGAPLQLVIGGPDFQTLSDWRDRIIDRARVELPELIGLDSDYRDTLPQLRIQIDQQRAAALGVPAQVIGTTLESMLGSRRVTTFERDGEEYDVLIQAAESDRAEPNDITNLYVRSTRSGELIPLANVVRVTEIADSGSLNRFNRTRAITLSARLPPNVGLGDALERLEALAREELPRTAIFDYKGESLELKRAGGAVALTFALALLIVYLVLAAQFESFLHPVGIMLTVPLAMFGAFVGLWLGGSSINLFSQIGIVMLIGLATKNGILIVEFANQLRDAGRSIDEAVLEASELRLRPILMTSLTTVAGAVPLILASGAGSASRYTIGVVVIAGVSFATLLTLFVVPALYRALAPYTRSPEAIGRQLDALEGERHGGETDSVVAGPVRAAREASRVPSIDNSARAT